MTFDETTAATTCDEAELMEGGTDLPTDVVLAGMIRGFTYQPDEITTKGEKNRK